MKPSIRFVFKNLPTLTTKRLILRRMKWQDISDIFEYARVPIVSQYLPWKPHASTKDTSKFMTGVLKKYTQGKPSDWVIVWKRTKKVIGTCGFHNYNTQHNSIELGYCLKHSYWNKGIMTEAVWAVIFFVFTKLDMHRIHARCDIENKASEGVMKKVGMKFEGILRDNAYRKKDKRYHSIKVYSILQHEYSGE